MTTRRVAVGERKHVKLEKETAPIFLVGRGASPRVARVMGWFAAKDATGIKARKSYKNPDSHGIANVASKAMSVANKSTKRMTEGAACAWHTYQAEPSAGQSQ